jgi:hypothetical protein
MKICPVGAVLYHADGRKDMTNLILAFRNSANAPQRRVMQFAVQCCSVHYIICTTHASTLLVSEG